MTIALSKILNGSITVSGLNGNNKRIQGVEGSRVQVDFHSPNRQRVKIELG